MDVFASFAILTEPLRLLLQNVLPQSDKRLVAWSIISGPLAQLRFGVQVEHGEAHPYVANRIEVAPTSCL